MTYYFIFGALLLFCLIDRSYKIPAIYWVCILSIYVFSAFRFEVGCDWPNYLRHYLIQQNRTWQEAIIQSSPSHWMLLHIMSALNLSYYWLNIITSAIFFAGLHSISRRSPAPMVILALSFPILVLNMPMAAVRQAAAIGLICYAFSAFIDKRIIKFIFLIFLASTFHGSAFIFLLMCPFIIGSFNLKNIFLASLLAVPGALLLLESDTAAIASERYIDSGVEASGAIFRAGFIGASGVLYFTMLSKPWRKFDPKSHTLISILAVAMCLLPFLLPISSVIADRFGYYLMVPQIWIFSMLPFLLKTKLGSIIRILPYIAVCVLFVFWTVLSQHFLRCYDPYMLIF